jgi:hypothetical protein
MNFNFGKIFERKKDSPEIIQEKENKIFEEANVFISNFYKKIEEARKILETEDENADQYVLDKIKSLYIDAESNLREVIDLLKQTEKGEEYFSIENSGNKDSLMLAQQEIVLEKTPFAVYPKMVKELINLKTDTLKKLMPEVSDLES